MADTATAGQGLAERGEGIVEAVESRPFDPLETGKIAVKVINHYGDEVLKVYTIG